jgi:hypothetical protein
MGVFTCEKNGIPFHINISILTKMSTFYVQNVPTKKLCNLGYTHKK